jgi:ketosteroid isomerase-like protein
MGANAQRTRVKHGKMTALLSSNPPMPKARKHAAHLSSTPNDIETAFYEAMQAGDLERLMACWADDDEIVCIHPGGPRIVGTAAIRAAFEAMFSEGGTINAHPEHIHRVDAMASAVHSVVERVEVLTPEGPVHAYVLATNAYHKTPQGWRMVVHHASPGTVDAIQDMQQVGQVLH